MKNSVNRRDFLRRASWAAAGIWAAPSLQRTLRAASPNEIIRHASIGTSGQAAGDIESLTRHPKLKLVAAADVDLGRAEALKKKFPDIKIYQDWRELLDKEKSIDSVNVTVPDHMHGPVAMSALQLGKHVYCQKPLTHDLYETRRLTEFAREKNLVTQMGIQIHSKGVYQQAALPPASPARSSGPAKSAKSKKSTPGARRNGVTTVRSRREMIPSPPI